MARKPSIKPIEQSLIIQLEEVLSVPLEVKMMEEPLSFDKALKLYKLENPNRALYMKDKEVILKFLSKHTSEVKMLKVQWFSLLSLF